MNRPYLTFVTFPVFSTFFLQTVSVTVSVLTLTFISIDRWYAICFPLRYKPRPERAWRSIALIWLIGFLSGKLSGPLKLILTRPLLVNIVVHHSSSYRIIRFPAVYINWHIKIFMINYHLVYTSIFCVPLAFWQFSSKINKSTFCWFHTKKTHVYVFLCKKSIFLPTIARFHRSVETVTK